MNTANFLSIPASMFPEQEIVVSGERRFTYAEMLGRVRRLSSALRARGVERGTKVAILATNSHRYLESFYATASSSSAMRIIPAGRRLASSSRSGA